MEIWKNIKGYEGYYQISNYGNVRALDYKVKTYRGERLKRGTSIKATDNGNGYKIVGLSKNNVRKNYYVHRLVAEAFLENPNNYAQVNHKDYDTSNNNVNNLEWVTPMQNVRYSLVNRKETCSTTTKYGRYITMDKRYNSLVVVVGLGNGKRKYLGSFKNLEDAIKCRDSFMQKII